MTPLVVPKTNLNGNSSRDLVRQLAEVLTAITRLKAAMAQAGADLVHGRNYITNPIGDQARAADAWNERRWLLESLDTEIRDLALAIQAQDR